MAFTTLGALATTALGSGFSGQMLGAGLSGLGGFLGGGAHNDMLQGAADAAAFQPFNIGGDLGSVQVGADGNVNLGMNQQQALLSGLLGGQTASALNPMFNQGLQGLQGAALGALPGLLNEFNASSSNIPTSAFNQNTTFQNALAQQALGAGGGALAGGLAGLGNAGAAFGQGQGFLNQASGLLGQSGNVQGLVDDRLSALRAQAAPQEERQFNSLQQRLFSQGRLGSTGGSRDIEAFARGLGESDLSRQMAAQQLGLDTSRLLQQGAGIAGGFGTNLFGQGFNASSALGNLGSGLLGQGSQFSGLGLQSAFGLNDLTNQRAQSRIAQMQNLFGFGQSGIGGGLQNALTGVQGINAVQSPLLSLGNLSANLSGVAANAGANQADILSNQTHTASGGGLIGGLLGGIGSLF